MKKLNRDLPKLPQLHHFGDAEEVVFFTQADGLAAHELAGGGHVHTDRQSSERANWSGRGMIGARPRSFSRPRWCSRQCKGCT